MAEKLRKHKSTALIMAGGLFLAVAALLTLSELVPLPDFASAATDTVTVTATVQSWMTFDVNPNAVTLSPDLVNTSGSPGIGSSTNITLQLGTNSSGGWNVTIEGLRGGLATSTYMILSVATGTVASTTLTAGTDGYGAHATSTLAGVTVDPRYNKWTTVTVAAISSTTIQTLATKTSANSSTTVATVKVFAAATGTAPSATYQDTITFTATSQ